MSWSALSSGDAVEVSDGRGESTWQSASIINHFINRHMYFVAFDNAITATVSSIRVRPRPESEHFTSNFELNQLVDVRFGSVWRPGVVCKVHVAEGRKFYGVNMGDTQMEIEHGRAEIRARVDWINGKWALATDRGKFTKSRNLGNSDSNSDVLHKSKTSRECKATNVVDSMRDLIDESPCEKLIATPLTNIGYKGVPTCQPCKITKAPDSVSPLHDSMVDSIYQSTVASSNLDKENKGCSDNLNFQTCKRARKEETMKDNPRILNIEKPTHSECLESSSSKKLKLDARMPVSNEDSSFNIKSMVDKLHYSELFETKESSINNLNQESGRSCNKAEHPKEKSMHDEPLTKLCSEGISLHNELRNTSSKPEGLSNKVACNSSGERRRKNSKPQKLVNVEPSLEASGRSFAFMEYIGYNHHISWGKNSNAPNIKKSSLPFKKCSILWDFVKSMEIFSVMPQDPHFSPLVKHCSKYPEGMDREAMAIGLMITFSKVVDDIPNLNISDPPDKFDEIAKALLNLQWHGFNVQKVQSRLVELIQLKKIHERLANKTSMLKAALQESNRKVKSSDGNLSGIEKNLCHLHELRGQVLMEEKEVDLQLSKLMVESDKFDEDIILAKIGFEHALSFP